MFESLALYTAWGVLALRVVYGLIFIAHGSQKLFGGIAGTAQFFEQIGFKPGKFWATLVGLVEFIGGIAMVLGLFTPWAALLTGIVMVVAIVKVKAKQGLVGGYEFDLLLLATALLFLLAGAGQYALDYTLLN